MQSSIIVAVRVRPFNTEEKPQLRTDKIYPLIDVVDDRVLVFDPKCDSLADSRRRDTRFAFDHVFAQNATQSTVYMKAAQPMIPHVLDGYNSTVFAYGATGCGKTHTINGTPTDPGILHMLVHDLFTAISQPDRSKAFTVVLSCLEVYNEHIFDLITPHTERTPVPLREVNGEVIPVGLTTVPIVSEQEALEAIASAGERRHVHATEANAASSRSHFVLSLTISQKSKLVLSGLEEEQTQSVLTVIDLAGSERASATKNRGARLAEGANINRSLLALGNCIKALCDAKRRSHVPYRDSKLTRLLKTSLSGNCRTCIIACISPSSANYDDTQNTLQYANRAKSIKTSSVRNAFNINRHVAQYVRTIYELQQEIVQLKKEANAQGPSPLHQSLQDMLPLVVRVLHSLAVHFFLSRLKALTPLVAGTPSEARVATHVAALEHQASFVLPQASLVSSWQRIMAVWMECSDTHESLWIDPPHAELNLTALPPPSLHYSSALAQDTRFVRLQINYARKTSLKHVFSLARMLSAYLLQSDPCLSKERLQEWVLDSQSDVQFMRGLGIQDLDISEVDLSSSSRMKTASPTVRQETTDTIRIHNAYPTTPNRLSSERSHARKIQRLKQNRLSADTASHPEKRRPRASPGHTKMPSKCQPTVTGVDTHCVSTDAPREPTTMNRGNHVSFEEAPQDLAKNTGSTQGETKPPRPVPKQSQIRSQTQKQRQPGVSLAAFTEGKSSTRAPTAKELAQTRKQLSILRKASKQLSREPLKPLEPENEEA